MQKGTDTFAGRENKAGYDRKAAKPLQSNYAAARERLC